MTDRDHMQQALALAAGGKGFTSPNPCVGAVVVTDGRVVGEGFHPAAGQPHAEVFAIDEAGARARGGTLYVTLEPCHHHGRTPPCTEKILSAGIRRVVVACPDPNPEASGGIAFLEQQGVEVVTGVLADAAKALNEDFLWYVTHDHHPFVILKSAATLDGYIATSGGESQWITGPEARAFGHGIRHQVDAILVGSGTLHADDPSLTCRIPGRKTRDPVRVILDTHLTIMDDARVLNHTSDAPTILVAGPGASADRKRQLTGRKRVTVLTVGIKDGRLDWHELLGTLGKMAVTSVLIEGGGTVAASALSSGIVNKVVYIVSPRLMGGNDGQAVFVGKGAVRLSDTVTLNRLSVERLGPDILCQGYVGSDPGPAALF